MALLSANETIKKCGDKEDELIKKIEEIKVRKSQCKEIVQENLQDMINNTDIYGPSLIWALQKIEEFGPKLVPEIFLQK